METLMAITLGMIVGLDIALLMLYKRIEKEFSDIIKK